MQAHGRITAGGHWVSIGYVVTTIQPPTEGVRKIATGAMKSGSPFVVVGDLKTPDDWSASGVEFLGFAAQHDLGFASASALPANSYARKNLGYLRLAELGCGWIRETDDDNSPYEDFFSPIPEALDVRTIANPRRFVNIYQYFTDRPVWPRGLPLNYTLFGVHDQGHSKAVVGPMVLQAVANGDPDVDAVYRLTAPDTSDVAFAAATPLLIDSATWTPFNSQATTWPRELLPIMYLPSTCSFRMTDIWRSYVAQRLMRGLGATLVITGPTVYQDRNEHNLMRDFRDEIEGYVGYERFVDTLEQSTIRGGFGALLDDLRELYVALIHAEFFTAEELSILDAWIADMESLGFGPPT